MPQTASDLNDHYHSQLTMARVYRAQGHLTQALDHYQAAYPTLLKTDSMKATVKNEMVETMDALNTWQRDLMAAKAEAKQARNTNRHLSHYEVALATGRSLS